MKKENTIETVDMKMVKHMFDTIIDYEKSWKSAKTNHSQNATTVPVNKILDYFGTETICELYGCTVVDEEIARRLIIKAFE